MVKGFDVLLYGTHLLLYLRASGSDLVGLHMDRFRTFLQMGGVLVQPQVDLMEGIHLMSNMRLCSNVPAQSIVQTALGGYQSVKNYVVPTGRVCKQRDYVYERLCAMDGVSVVKPKAAFYIFPRLDPEKFNITDDEQFQLDLLQDKRVLIVPGKGFNWQTPGYFRIVYLPRRAVLEEALDALEDFLKYYRQ